MLTACRATCIPRPKGCGASDRRQAHVLRAEPVAGAAREALHAAIADSSYAEIDAGHVVFFEKPDEFVKVVSGFTSAS